MAVAPKSKTPEFRTPESKTTRIPSTPGTGNSKISASSSEGGPLVRAPIKSDSVVMESVIKQERFTWPLDTTQSKKVVYVDIPKDKIDDDMKAFVKVMARKPVQLEMLYSYQTRITRRFTGQAGVIKDEKGDFYLVTAKHNVANDNKTRMELHLLQAQYWHYSEKILAAKSGMKLDGHQSNWAAAWPVSLRDGISWRGWDVSTGRVFMPDDDVMCGGFAVRPSACTFDGFDSSRAFEKVPSGFQCQVGQKIAVVVSSFLLLATATPTTVCGGCTQEDLNKIFAKPGGIELKAGEILHVGQDHIEHDINTYQGCSGALVFLLEGPHRGKVIAVHVGYHPELSANVALKIIEGWKPSLALRGRQLQGMLFSSSLSGGMTNTSPPEPESGKLTDAKNNDLECFECEMAPSNDSNTSA